MAKKTKKCKTCGEKKDIKMFKPNTKTKDGYISVCKDCINANRKENNKNIKHDHFYIYRFLDKENMILYVGKTTNINNRIYAHIQNHLTWKTPEKFDLYNNVHKVEFCEVESEYHMNIYEIHYICKYNPLHNIEFKSNNINLFSLPEIIWKPYILKSYINGCGLYYFHNFKMSIKDINDKLKNDIDFYNDFVKEYLEDNYVHKTFNPDSYEFNPNTGQDEFIDDYEDIEEEIIIEQK